MSQLKECPACDETIEWNDDVVIVENDVYHDKCIELYPTGFVAFIGDECLGETENDDGEMACICLNEGEYIDVEDKE